MAQFLLDFGAKIDVLTKGELDESLSQAAAIWREEARGVRYVRRAYLPNAISALADGPASGFAWDVKLISAVVSAAADVTVYQGESAANVTGWQSVAAAGPAVLTWSSHEWVLPGGEKISVVASAGVISRLFLTAVEVPAERIGVLLA